MYPYREIVQVIKCELKKDKEKKSMSFSQFSHHNKIYSLT